MSKLIVGNWFVASQDQNVGKSLTNQFGQVLARISGGEYKVAVWGEISELENGRKQYPGKTPAEVREEWSTSVRYTVVASAELRGADLFDTFEEMWKLWAA